MSHDPGSRSDALPDVDQLDLVGVHHVDLGMAGPERVECRPIPLGQGQFGGQFLSLGNAQHPANPIVSVTAILERGSSGRTRQFYNVF